jgi:methyl-accepting chemotaxis protein
LGFGGLTAGLGLFLLFDQDFVPAVFGASRVSYFLPLFAVFAVGPALAVFVADMVSTRRRRWLEVAIRVLGAGALLVCAGVAADFGLATVTYPWLVAFLAFILASIGVGVDEIRHGNREAWLFIVAMLLIIVAAVAQALAIVLGGSSGMAMVVGVASFLAVNFVLVLRRYLRLARGAWTEAERLGAREHEVQRLVEELSTWAAQLQGAVQGLSDANAAETEVLQRQGAAVMEAQTTTEGIGDAFALARTRAEEVTGTASRAEAAGQEGGMALQATLANLDAVRAAVSTTVRQVSALGTRSDELVQVVEAVRDLSEQSKLMALNARLEAARSGEKGFAVVASEMGRLADESSASAEHIGVALEQLHGAVGETVRLSEGSSQQVDQALEQIQKSGQRLQEIATIAGSAGTGAREIATAIGQQDAGIRTILTVLGELAEQATSAAGTLEASKRNAAHVQEVAAGLLGAAERAKSLLRGDSGGSAAAAVEPPADPGKRRAASSSAPR